MRYNLGIIVHNSPFHSIPSQCDSSNEGSQHTLLLRIKKMISIILRNLPYLCALKMGFSFPEQSQSTKSLKRKNPFSIRIIQDWFRFIVERKKLSHN